MCSQADKNLNFELPVKKNLNFEIPVMNVILIACQKHSHKVKNDATKQVIRDPHNLQMCKVGET